MENIHFAVFGKPGSGKSTFLKNEIIKDIEIGRSVVFIDPHGEDALDLLDAIPRSRIRDVCYLDASDKEYAVAFDPLDAPHRLVSALKTIFTDSWGPRLEQGLRNGLAAICEAGLTLHDLSPMFYDKGHRARVLKHVTKASTLTYWTELFPTAYNDRQQQEAASPIYNKIDAILASDISRHLTQRNPRLNFQELLQHHRILIVNLAVPSIGEDAATVLGSLLTTTFRNNLMSYPAPASFFADEFQIYGRDVYISMLRELRKFGLRLGVATQFTEGIDDTLMAAILGTVKDLIVFTVSHDDALRLAPNFNRDHQPFNPVALTTTLPHTAYVNGVEVQMPPFTKATGSQDAVAKQSRRRYARSIKSPPRHLRLSSPKRKN